MIIRRPTVLRGFTLTELLIAMSLMAVVVLAFAVVLVDGERNWSFQYDRIYSDVVTNGYVARRKFDTVMRTASREKILLDDAGKCTGHDVKIYTRRAFVQKNREH